MTISMEMAATATTTSPPGTGPSEKNMGCGVSSAAHHAPVSGWRRMMADWRMVGGATAVCQVMGAATSLLLRVLLDPAQMGIWQTLKLLLNYGNYANLGISKGAVREYTIALGRDAASNAHAEKGN